VANVVEIEVTGSTGIVAGVIAQAGPAITGDMITSLESDSPLVAGESIGSSVTVETVAFDWSLNPTSSELTFSAISISIAAIATIISEGLEFALAQNADGFGANINDNNGNIFVLDIFLSKH
jgi:hypothetical protein